ncbi:MAG TPA: hypothetical protein EYP68_02605 [Candidatus Korarchaeota archaeon]|nr:hypothetical protein [Candidatus Korarchaeota archaeon]
MSVEGTSIDLERYVGAVHRGWTSLYPYWIKIESSLNPGEITVKIDHRKIPKVPLYSQGEVIATMRERGIGRPSTYAVILQKLLMRRYVIERKGKLIPTKLGMMVYDYLIKNYSNLISEKRTRVLEDKMSKVEEGAANYQEILNEVYQEIKSSIQGK